MVSYPKVTVDSALSLNLTLNQNRVDEQVWVVFLAGVLIGRPALAVFWGASKIFLRWIFNMMVWRWIRAGMVWVLDDKKEFGGGEVEVEVM